MKTKSALTTLLFFVFSIICFSQNNIHSITDSANQVSTDYAFDVIKINDTTFHCICKYDDPNNFVGLGQDDFLKMFGSNTKPIIHLTITFKQKSKIKYELTYKKQVEIEEFIYYGKKLWSAKFNDENSGDYLSSVSYDIGGYNPFNYYQLESTGSKKNNVTTNIEFYSKGRVKSVEIEDHNNGLHKTIIKTCFNKKGKKIKCPPPSLFL